MSEFSSRRIVGGLLSSDLLDRVFAGDKAVAGTSPESYGLEKGESIRRQASRSWPYLLETWQDEKKRDRFTRILLRELGFGQQMPAHIAFRALGWDIDLDHRTPNREARAPQSVMQQALNTDGTRLWGLLCNGTTLRLLRDSAALVGSAYVEFDLRAIFDGELFSDFVQVYLVCHESRFAVQCDGGPESCYLEQWRTASADQGERVLDQLRKGVEQAISILGTGFIAHPANPHLRGQLAGNELRLDDLNRALLRVVYRVLFWFVAEDRDALLLPLPADVSAETSARLREARERYGTYFSATRLRQIARRQRGTRHTDLHDAVGLVFDALGSEGGVPQLALPGIGGIFETGALDEPLNGARLTNEALLSAIRALAWFKSREGGPLRRVDFGNLGAEELGSIYESLLELIPHYDPDNRAYTLTVLPGNERKESGSYYTPTSLVECLLDSALDPLLDEATAKGSPEEKVAALLDLTVCDPACGSGHFLVAAARRLAKRIAAEETGEAEPPEPDIRKALRRVVGRCIYGVDINPMAAELARVSLWLEALEPGKPLSYLDQNIRVGNSLLGVTPALLADGLPDAAFTPIEGDDRKVCTALKKQNAAERVGQHDLFSQSGIPVTNAILAKRADTITQTLPDSLEDLHIHQQRQAEALTASDERRVQKLIADAWCAAFVQPKTEETRSTAITHAVIENLAADKSSLDLAVVEDLVADLTRQYRFFHWHVEFPHIFRVGGGSPAGWSGGFSCVIGNPPWERINIREQEFFGARHREIADIKNAAQRKKAIEDLNASPRLAERQLYGEFQAALRSAAGSIGFSRASGRYPLAGRGDVNTYALFAESAHAITAPQGRAGLIIPTGVATDATTQHLFKAFVASSGIVSLYDFENSLGIFPGVHRSYKFCLLTLTGRRAKIQRSRFAFYLTSVSDLARSEASFTLAADEIKLLNPNTQTLPIFRTRRDVELTLAIYRRLPVIEITDKAAPTNWRLRPTQMFDVTHDAGLFEAEPAESRMPLMEGRLIQQFTHRWATYCSGEVRTPSATELDDPNWRITPKNWIESGAVRRKLAGKWERPWLPVWRGIARATDERTVISTILPLAATNNKIPVITGIPVAEDVICVVAAMNSFVFDYVDRQKQSGVNLNTFILQQLPMLTRDDFRSAAPWVGEPLFEWLRRYVLELAYTTWDMEPFARDLGDDSAPFHWNEERRFLMRAELDAAFFRLYGIEQDDVDYIMETFPIVKRKDIAAHGTYRTKEAILKIYDAMAVAKAAGTSYQTELNPPPGQGPRHPAR